MPGTRVAPPSDRLWMNGASPIASCPSLSCSTSRPRFQVVSTAKTARPKASGNQPPAKILSELAEKNARSISTKGRTQQSASAGFHPHWSRATTKTSTLVMSMVPVTAMPYAAARLLDEPKPITSAITATSSSQLIAAR